MRKTSQKKRQAYREIAVNSSPSLSLVVIDQNPIRKKHIMGCKRAIKDLNKARGELFLFENQDLPKYNQWYKRTFEKELSNVREAQDKAGEAFLLIKDIEFIKYKLHISYYEAYRIALDKKKNPQKYEHIFSEKYEREEDFEEEEDDDDEEDDFSDENKLEDDEIELLFNDFLRKNPDIHEAAKDKKVYEFIFKKFKKRFETKEENYTPKEKIKPKTPVDNSLQERIKTIYRTLARKLHPDYRKEEGEHYENLWFQVQEAYKSCNLEKLEILNSQFNAYEGNFGDEFSIFQIISAKEKYKHQLKDIRTKIKNAKKDIAWGFSKFGKKETQSIQEKIKIQLKNEISEHNQNLLYFNQVLRDWSIPPIKGRKYKESFGRDEDDFLIHIF